MSWLIEGKCQSKRTICFHLKFIDALRSVLAINNLLHVKCLTDFYTNVVTLNIKNSRKIWNNVNWLRQWEIDLCQIHLYRSCIYRILYIYVGRHVFQTVSIYNRPNTANSNTCSSLWKLLFTWKQSFQVLTIHLEMLHRSNLSIYSRPSIWLCKSSTFYLTKFPCTSLSRKT